MVLKKFILLFASIILIGCATPAPSKEDRDDVESLVSMSEGGGLCDLNTALDKFDDELLIRFVGHKILTGGTPKATSAKQADFYRLALESKKFPTDKDKEVLIDAYSVGVSEKCRNAMFSFNSPILRDALASGYQKNLQLISDIKAGRLTYEQISVRASDQNLQGFERTLFAVLQQDAALRARLDKALENSIGVRVFDLLTKYDINPNSR